MVFLVQILWNVRKFAAAGGRSTVSAAVMKAGGDEGRSSSRFDDCSWGCLFGGSLAAMPRQENGDLKEEMILVCNALRSDLMHANEYIRGAHGHSAFAAVVVLKLLSAAYR